MRDFSDLILSDAFHRSIGFDQRSIDEEKREVKLSFSSETEEIERWFGIEILDHSTAAVDLSRLNTIGAFILNHDPNRIIGPIKRAWIEGGRGQAIAGFDKTPEGDLALERMKSGSLRGTSLFYRAARMKELLPGEEYKLATKTITGRRDKSIFIVTRWQPIEITATPIPADPSVGIGRELTRSLQGIEIISRKGERKMETGSDVAERGLTLLDRVSVLQDRTGEDLTPMKGQIADLLLTGKATEADNLVLDKMAEIARRENGGLEGSPNVCFRDVTDDEFFEALKSPTEFLPNRLGSGSRRADSREADARSLPGNSGFSGVSDEAFFEALLNPSQF